MSWEIVAEGPPNDFQELKTLVGHGTPLRLEVQTLPGLAYAAEVPGAGWVAEMAASGMKVDRVYSEDGDMVIVEGKAESLIVPIILAILAVLAIGGIAYIVKHLTLLANIVGPEVVKGAIVIGSVVAVGCVVLALLSAARGAT